MYFAWRSDGDGKVTAIFASKADADAGFPKVQAIWADLASLLKAPPSIETYDNVEHITR